VGEESGGQAAGNGAVMRCAPVALRWCGRGRELVEQARRSALVTHHDPRCVWTTVAVVAALALALEGQELDLEALASALDEAGAPSEVGAAARAVAGASLADLALDDRAMGYTVKAMQVGLWALRREANLESVLVEVVSEGGDADTNGAVAGAVLGARDGEAAIPARWLRAIRDVERLRALADALHEASTGP
jgi:ADP-ribosyl-[dinitrogen reductase] hydrolase